MPDWPALGRRDFLKGALALGASTLLPRRYAPPPLPRPAARAAGAAPLPPVEEDLAVALDPARLARRAGLAPDPWQVAFLRSQARQILLNTSRQVGKSSVTAILAAHTALYTAEAPVLLLSPSLRQSGQLFGKVRRALKQLGADTAPVVTDSALSLRLANGSEIHSLPGRSGTVRGFSGVKLAIIDEAAFVADDLLAAVSPMLATSGGRLILLSTPFGKRGRFYEEWSDGGAAWERFRVTAEDCPRIPPAFLAEERRKLGPAIYSQEYSCAFLDAIRSVFAADDIAAALDNTLTPLRTLAEVA
jgi:hypothetical protein